MKRIKSSRWLPAVGIAAVLVFCLGVTARVRANPLQFKPTTQTATATTSPAFLKAGAATSTLPFDAYATGQPYASDYATLFIQLAASSTSTTLNTDIEYSQDGIDWYQDGGTIENNFATTTKPFSITAVNEYQWTFSSSTAGLGAVSSSNATSTRALLIRTPTRYVRAVFTLPIGSAAGAVWGQWQPVRQATQ